MDPQDGALIAHPSAHRPVETMAVSPEAIVYAQGALAPSTWAAYTADWARFTRWCQDQDVDPLPVGPAVLVEYIASHAKLVDDDGRPTYSPATISRWISSINAVHAREGMAAPGAHPQVKVVLAGVRRLSGAARPTRRVAPLMRDDLAHVLQVAREGTYPGGVHAARDACLLLFGFVGAFRREELSRLRVADVTRHRDDGLHVKVRRSKTDQESRGAVKALPYGQRPITCAPCAFVRWVHVLDAGHERAQVMAAVFEVAGGAGHVCRAPEFEAHSLDGDRPLFPVVHRSGRVQPDAMGGHGVNLVVKRRTMAAGLDASRFGGHSMRAGFVTQAVRAGASSLEVMRQTQHTNPATVAVYSRDNDPLAGNAVTRLGL
ncbi:site-specific integrase [Oerskovia merdavium]|uniref:Tyrosine-type recombinase/integrase n=1 Tax=Oerskovia merdavium TaxID=2762227 RepID=A0ABR8U5H1_9CELL|nr:site-specific integrase [Oerskovia merdavium]MBD7982784.1 tyrosine-type recombinase/integrase [Oerskovia merdavium]